jgi:hypothetical protein
LPISSKLIHDDAGENEELGWDFIELEYPRSDDSGKTNSEVWGCWLVARTDTKSAKRGNVEKKTKKAKMPSL